MNGFFFVLWRILIRSVLKIAFNVSVGNFWMKFFLNKKSVFYHIRTRSEHFRPLSGTFSAGLWELHPRCPEEHFEEKMSLEILKFFSSFLDFARRLLNFGKIFFAGLCLNCILRVYNKIFRERSFLEIYIFFHHFRSLRKSFCWSVFGGAMESATYLSDGKKLIKKMIFFEKHFLPCLDTVLKILAFSWNFSSAVVKTAKYVSTKKFSVLKVFWKNEYFFHCFVTLMFFSGPSGNFFFEWVVRSERYVSVEDFWEKKIKKDELLHRFWPMDGKFWPFDEIFSARFSNFPYTCS